MKGGRKTFRGKCSWLFTFFCTFANCLINILKGLNIVNYKELLNRAVLLISSPAKAWEEIVKENNRKKVMSEFVYPMIGLCGLSVFIGTFIGNTAGVSAFQIAMTRCCATFVSLFGGFFLASYLTNLLGKQILGREDETEQNQQFVGYAMVVTFLLEIITGLFSLSILRWILQFYTVFVVYEGARSLMNVEPKSLTRYSLIASVIVIICPSLIGAIFDKLSLILN